LRFPLDVFGLIFEFHNFSFDELILFSLGLNVTVELSHGLGVEHLFFFGFGL